MFWTQSEVDTNKFDCNHFTLFEEENLSLPFSRWKTEIESHIHPNQTTVKHIAIHIFGRIQHMSFRAICGNSGKFESNTGICPTIKKKRFGRELVAKSSVVVSFSLYVHLYAGNCPSSRNIKIANGKIRNGDFTTENAYDFEENRGAIFRLNFYNGNFFLAKVVDLDWLLESGRPMK